MNFTISVLKMTHRFTIPETSTSWKNLPETPVLEGRFFPPPNQVMRVFSEGPGATDLEKISVVIIGQDPYPELGFANGFAFAISPTASKVPVSLQRIKSELAKQYNVGVDVMKNFQNSLEHWAQQGVFLINVGLTVLPGAAGSQIALWQKFTTEVIKRVGAPSKNPRVFILWGNSARALSKYIDKMHCVLTSSHPTSRDGGFYGQQHFVRANNFLARHERNPIMWFGENNAELVNKMIETPGVLQKIVEKQEQRMQKINLEIEDIKIQKTELTDLLESTTEYEKIYKEMDDLSDHIIELFDQLEISISTIKDERIPATLKLLSDDIGLLKEDLGELTKIMTEILAAARKK